MTFVFLQVAASKRSKLERFPTKLRRWLYNLFNYWPFKRQFLLLSDLFLINFNTATNIKLSARYNELSEQICWTGFLLKAWIDALWRIESLCSQSFWVFSRWSVKVEVDFRLPLNCRRNSLRFSFVLNHFKRWFDENTNLLARIYLIMQCYTTETLHS